tara:strand:- start:581 stop:862 length:282 start_codon:yes stop_codon:yes gene_type:complete
MKGINENSQIHISVAFLIKALIAISALIAGYYQIQIRFLAMERSMGEIHAEQIILSQKVSAMEKEHLEQLESQNEVLEQENRSLMQRIGLKKP